ncbi:MAG: tetratricopeptide repeat protein [bacterium]
MRKLLKLLCGTLYIISISLSTINAGEVVNNQTSLLLKLDVVLSKNEYLEREPIIVNATLTNGGSVSLKVAEPLVLHHFLKYKIIKIGGDISKEPRLMPMIVGFPKDYGINLTPGQSISCAWNLNEDFPFGLSLGDYKIKFIYTTEGYQKEYPEIYSQHIEYETISFRIIPPAGKDKKALEIWKQALEKFNLHGKDKDNRLALKYFKKIVREYSTSNYAIHAYYYTGKCFLRLHDFEQVIVEYKNFINKYPDYPYYSENSQKFIAVGYYMMKDYKRARLAYQKLPDSYEKKQWIKRCEDKLLK